jgi:RHS repeat-associated protein
MTDQTGTPVARYDLLPFGQELLPPPSGGRAGVMCGLAPCYGQSSAVVQKFTAKERDSETGLDYFGVRYLSSAQSRFTSPDPENATASLSSSESWNAYSYVLNNPYKYTDPDGEAPLLVTAGLGAVIGSTFGAGSNLLSQLVTNGWVLRDVDLRQVESAAVGGFIEGGVAGLTLGIGSGAVTIGRAAVTNAGTNVLGGFVTRLWNARLGVPEGPNPPSESLSVAVDAAAGLIGGGAGAWVAKVKFPIPNVRHELFVISQTGRRHLRGARSEALLQRVERQELLHVTTDSIIGTSVTNFFTDSSFRGRTIIDLPREQITTKICYLDEKGKKVCH